MSRRRKQSWERPDAAQPRTIMVGVVAEGADEIVRVDGIRIAKRNGPAEWTPLVAGWRVVQGMADVGIFDPDGWFYPPQPPEQLSFDFGSPGK